MTPSRFEPRTEAGRDYVALAPDNGTREARHYIVLAIENEARADALDEGVLAEALSRMNPWDESSYSQGFAETLATEYRAIVAGTER